MKFLDLLDRVVASLVFIPILIVVIYYGGASFFFVITGTIILGLMEFYNLQKATAHPQYETGIIITILLCIGIYKGIVPAQAILIFLVLFTLMIGVLRKGFHQERTYDVLKNSALTIFGVLYVAFLLSYLFPLREMGARFVYFLFIVTWMGDAGAYFVGIKWGRRKLIPSISPHKSLEGAIGGIAACIGSIFVLKYILQPLYPPITLNPGHIIGLGFLMGACGQLGDFAESIMKRELQTKDSGSFIPGHGGILDRFDSLLFTTPLFYYYLLFFP